MSKAKDTTVRVLTVQQYVKLATLRFKTRLWADEHRAPSDDELANFQQLALDQMQKNNDEALIARKKEKEAAALKASLSKGLNTGIITLAPKTLHRAPSKN